jgi:hypothetical protein
VAGSGTVVGPDERIPAYAALRAVTSMAAFQIREEKSKGTLEVGKLADLVILDRNPLKVEPTSIKDIVVEETIKEGLTVYQKSATTGALPQGPGTGLCVCSLQPVRFPRPLDMVNAAVLGRLAMAAGMQPE